MWTLLQPDYAHSGGDRTAGDDDALASAVNELRDLAGETRKLFWVERVGARVSENAGAELEENAPAFSGHMELVSKSENERAQKQFPRFYLDRNYTGDRNIVEPGCSRPNSSDFEIACVHVFQSRCLPDLLAHAGKTLLNISALCLLLLPTPYTQKM